MKSSLKSVSRNFFVLAGSLIFTFALAEASFRLAGVSPLPFSVHGVKSFNPKLVTAKTLETSEYPDDVLYERTPTGSRLKANAHLIIRNHHLNQRTIEIHTNSLGFRGPEVPPKKKNELRILALGDSITLGDYADQDKTYPAQLEKFLSEKLSPGRPVTVVNSGVGSIGIDTELSLLVERGFLVEPNVILLGLYLNDARDSFSVRSSQTPLWIRKSHFLAFVAERLELAKILWAYRQTKQALIDQENLNLVSSPQEPWRTSEAGFNHQITQSFADWGYAWSDGSWARMEEILTLIKSAAGARNAKLLVMLFPVKFQVEADFLRDEPQKKFRVVMENLGLPHLDLLPLLRERFQKEQKSQFYDQCHLKDEANAWVGEAAAEFILENLPASS